jgi:hypothetical protein
MPSKVVKKARPAKMSQYSKSAMNNPIKAMKEEGKSIQAAALQYSVLGITLQDQVADVHSPQHGCPTHPIEECLLVKHIALLADGGFPLTQIDVTAFVNTTLLILHTLTKLNKDKTLALVF